MCFAVLKGTWRTVDQAVLNFRLREKMEGDGDGKAFGCKVGTFLKGFLYVRHFLYSSYIEASYIFFNFGSI